MLDSSPVRCSLGITRTSNETCSSPFLVGVGSKGIQMTLEQLLGLALRYGFEASIVGLVVFLLIKFFLPSYFSEKGKNLATKEDIEEITNNIESVKSSYAHVLEELKSDNQLKLAEIEREKDIKKEVYLQAVEALTRSQNVVASLSNLNINEQQITSSMTDDAGSIAKVQIVGSEKTVKAITTIMSSIGSAILELMLERSVLVNRKNTIELLGTYRLKAADEISRYISVMTNINIEGNHDQRLWEAINRNVEFQTQQRDKYTQEINDLWVTQNKAHIEFAQKCMDEYFEISSLLPAAVLSVREELNLHISNEAYLDIFNQNIESGRRVLSDFYKKV